MRKTLSALAPLALALAACGDGNSFTQPSGCASTSTAVTVQNNSFSVPCTTIGVGATVTWTWGSNAINHNVTFADNASATQTAGTFQKAFPAAGTFAYRCTLHAPMTGTIKVE